MCGLAGFLHGGLSFDAASARLEDMLATIVHRGPDDGGVWIDEVNRVALGHRRLSVLDLSFAGHQPMESPGGRYVLVFNGEIYNHLDLRRMLGPEVEWRGHSDTETLLACFESLGLERTLRATIGMFSLALWDRSDRTLFLARDRMGEKPLYFGWQNKCFLFGSELKALRAHPAFARSIDWSAASTFLRLGYIPAPSTIYSGLFKLLPGTYIGLTEAHAAQRVSPEPTPYWSLTEVALGGLDVPFEGSLEEAVDELQSLLADAVRLQSIADVPLGAFLSGGIDSSAVVAVMNSVTPGSITTFSIGMPDRAMDESAHASAVARHLGTKHVEHTIQPQEALALIPRITEIWDEPFADSSQIPTFLLSSIARRTVIVALSGDGGDEFFLGYSQYQFYQRLWKSRGLGRLPWNTLLSAGRVVGRFPKAGRFFTRAQSIIEAWRQPNAQQLNGYWMDPYRGGPVPLLTEGEIERRECPALLDIASSVGLCDARTYLPDDILVKVDRASMACSLETRCPLLDHRIIEFAYRLPLDYKIHRGVGKRVLREVLYRFVPRDLVDRPKMGFSIPLGTWLRSELREWAESLISTIPNSHPQLDRTHISQLWREHLAGRERTSQLWAVLVLLCFLD